MNDLQKKLLISVLCLGAIYYPIIMYPGSFVYVFIALLVSIITYSFFFFNLKFKKEELVSKVKFLTLPILFNLGSSFYLVSLFQKTTQFIFVIFIVAFNFYIFQALKKVQNLGERAASLHRNILVSATFITLLLTLSMIYREYIYLSTSILFNYLPLFVVILNAILFYVLAHFLAWENGINLKKFLPYNIVNTLLSAEISLISIIWIVNYPVFSTVERASLGGIPLPAVLLTIIFYFIWGIISHKMDKSLTRRVMTEYLFVAVLFISVLLFTAKWLPLI